MSDRHPGLAIVTGASNGIGEALANVLADEGFDLVLAARGDELDDVASRLRSQGVEVIPVKVDLATPEGVESLHDAVTGLARPVEVLALNAGIAVSGSFVEEIPLERELALVDLNVRSTVHLAKLVIPSMVERGAGRVLITSSLAATLPGPFLATYNASKSFVQSFALALREELGGTGVTVTALMRGATETAIFADAGALDTKLGASERKADPAVVARQAYDAMMSGRERVVAGSVTAKVQAVLSRFVPDRLKAKLTRTVTEPGTA